MKFNVDPNNVYRIFYRGGCGGEWWAKFLNQHDECVPATYWVTGHNRHMLHFEHEINIEPTSNSKKVFLCEHPARPQEYINQPGSVMLDYDRYHGDYYFLLFALKALLQKHPNLEPAKTTIHPDQAQQLPQVFDKGWHYSAELDDWLQGVPTRSWQQVVADQWDMHIMGTWEQDLQPAWQGHVINIADFYFGDAHRHYANLCDRFGLEPLPYAPWQVKLYHQRNTAMIHQYLDCSFEQFLEQSREQKWLSIMAACERRHAQPLDHDLQLGVHKIQSA